jgi:ketosteroid isomerase-like protein
MRKLDQYMARSILESTHHAWCKGEIERLLSYYADDCTYWNNAGSLDGAPFILEGKAHFRTFLTSIYAVAESATVIESFQFEDGVACANVAAYIRHRRTGHVLSGTFRQVITYRGRKIQRNEEYHDAAKMAAFWKMVTCDDSGEGLKTIEGSKTIEKSE